MSKFLIPIIIIIILASLAGSMYAGMSLVTIIFDDMEFNIPEIPELVPKLSDDSNFEDIKIEKKVQPTILTDKETYLADEIIHVSGEAIPEVVRIQLTHLNGDNIVGAWIGPSGISYQYDIVLMDYYQTNLNTSGEYIINALDIDNNIVVSKNVFINTPTTPGTPQNVSKTVIEFQLEKYAYVENESIRVIGQITNPVFSKETSIDMYDADTGMWIKGFVHDSSNIVSKEGRFEIMFGLNWLNLDGLYMVAVSHNGVNASKYFTVESKEISEMFTTQWSPQVSIPAEESFGSFARCPEGKYVIDGGVQIIDGELTVLDSQPSGSIKSTDEFSSWRGIVRNDGTTDGNYKVYVKCKSSK